MKSYDELKAEMEAIQQQVIEAKAEELEKCLKSKNNNFNSCLLMDGVSD
tara:strand:+ start:7585 stop:7731 length:147 start_codon:yes stop_codon:yes gene_type:complete